jgi:hypothetical protein
MRHRVRPQAHEGLFRKWNDLEFSSRERRRPAGLNAYTTEDAAENAFASGITIDHTLMHKPAGRRRSREEKAFSCIIGCALARERLFRK